MSDDEQAPSHEEGVSEAKLRMEQEKEKRKQKAEEEWQEYEEMRKVEREKEKQEIQELRERREKRKMERAEEEKRLAELRAIEDQKRRAEEEERQSKKRAEEQRKKEERDRKRREAEEKSKESSKPNFIINKRLSAMMDAAENGETEKSKEQLMQERKAALEQICKPLSIDGFSSDQLKQKANELLNQIKNLESTKYDLSKRFEKQSLDMQELAERARALNRGGQGKNPQVKTNTDPDPLAAKISGLPPKIVMYSQYERVKDPRSFGDRQTLFTGPLTKDAYTRISPTTKIVMTENGAKAIEIDENGVEGGEAETAEAAE